MTTSRRAMLCAPALALAETGDAAAHIPLLDSHIHLLDPFRPQGAPWPPKDNAVLYKTALPPRYRGIAVPLGVVGAVVVEASPWVEDNQWVLDVAAGDPIVVGTVGNLEPDKPEFPAQLDRFHKNPLFRGIRYGYLWDRSLEKALTKPAFIAGLKRVAAADLSLDSANPTPTLLRDLLHATDRVPSLRVIVDHLPRMNPPEDAPGRRALEADLREIAKRPNIFTKVSGVLRAEDGRVPLDLAFYRPRLDYIFETFGEDRVLFGSDWPFADQWGTYEQGLRIVREYFLAKGTAIAEKYFWKNSITAYKWKPRTPAQPRL